VLTLHGETIFILEDDDIFRTRLSRAFEKRGAAVVQAADCATAQNRIAEGKVDYAVLDLCLPDGSGIEVLEMLIKKYPQVRSVILTGYGTISTAVEATKLGAIEFLTKPTNPDRILSSLLGEPLTGSLMKNSSVPAPTLAQVEWEHIHRVMNDCDGNVSRAAKVLGLHRRSLQRKLGRDPGRLE
jgi:two-component system response regulator RegA